MHGLLIFWSTLILLVLLHRWNTFRVAIKQIRRDLQLNGYQYIRLNFTFSDFDYLPESGWMMKPIVRPRFPRVYFRELHFIGADLKPVKMLVAIEGYIIKVKVYYEKEVIFNISG